MLDEKQLGEFIDCRFTRCLFRLETLDAYAVTSDGGDFHRYLAGEAGPDMDRKGRWMDHIRGEVAKGLHTYRVHVVRGPLTDYLRFECEWGYVYNAQAGEHIRVLDLAETPRPAGLVDEDFWLIDDEAVVRMDYDQDGRYLGAEVLPEEALEPYLIAKRAAWSAATDFSEYWAAHPEFWRDRNVG